MRKQHDHSDFILNLKINLKNYFFFSMFHFVLSSWTVWHIEDYSEFFHEVYW